MTGIDFTSTNNIFYGDRRVVGAYVYVSPDESPYAQRHTVFEYEKPIVNLALNQPAFGQYTSPRNGDGPQSITDGDFDTYLSQGEGYYTTRFGVQFADENGDSTQKQWNKVRFYTFGLVNDRNYNKTYLRMRTEPFDKLAMGRSQYGSNFGMNEHWSSILSSSPTIITGVVSPNGKTYTVLEFSLSTPRQSYGVMIENSQTRASNIAINELEVFYDE